jgi:uncharacterized protein with ParB-like and HNH nuclease domain
MIDALKNIQIQFSYLDVENCFKNFYVVPDYQREYVWTHIEVNQLLDDVFDEFEANPFKDYFIGSTVVFKNSDSLYELIDGQQRTTTVFLFICAFKSIYKDKNIDIDALERMIKDKIVDASGDSVDRYKLELQYSDSSNILAKITNNNEKPENLIGSAERLYSAYDAIIFFLREQFKDNADDTKLKKFFVYILRRLKFIQVETPEINDALKIFETINERGIGLSPMDLLKNLLFRQVERSKFNSLKQKWQSLITLLEKNNEKPLRFLRYFIMANFKVNNQRGEEVIREDEIYKWFIKPENIVQCNYEKRPLEFIELMLANATCYINFFKGKNNDDSVNVYLDNIIKLGGGSFKQHLLLFLAARNMPLEQFNYFAKHVETLVFYYFITKEPTKEFERNFSKWAKDIIKIKTQEELNAFIKKHFEPTIQLKQNEYKLRFTEARQNNIQQYRIRYILAKIAQYLDQERLGTYTPQTLNTYITKGVEVEHILPFNPGSQLKADIGEEYDDLKIRLGNLTLLEKPMNIVVSNDFFNAKVIEYAKSPYYITKSISVLDTVGQNSAINRLNQKLLSFNSWNKQSIIERQEMLLNLSKEIWKLEC